MYQPNFCAECGARIERERWRLWTSRRFCAACDRRLRKRRILAPLSLCTVLLAVGFVAGRAVRPSPPPLVIIRGGAIEAPGPSRQAGSTAQTAPPADTGARGSESHHGADGTARERPTDPTEVVSVCGARTKKGTPCSRRVRGTGRCWQHRGMPAILPPAKLVVPE